MSTTLFFYDVLMLSTGPTSIDYVADSGEELHTHTYDSILRCSTGLDNVSIAYISVTENKSHCHVFQCLDLQEVSLSYLLIVLGWVCDFSL